MDRLKTILIIYFISCIGVSQAQDITHVNARKFILQMLKIYSPEHYEMLERYNKTPSKVQLPNATFNIGRHVDFMYYISDTTRRELILNNLSVMIHEMTHSYSHRGAYAYLAEKQIDYTGENYICFYLNQKISVFVKQQTAFPAKEIVERIPDELRISKFEEYIGTDNKSMLPQKNGIYGLLDEWNAFYHETLMAFEVKEYYEREAYQNEKHWEDFYANYYESHTSFMEFKYYILSYLAYAKDKYPEFYNNLMKDDQFRNAYKEINKHFAKLIAEFEVYSPLVINLLKKINVDVKDEIVDGFHLLFIDGVGIDTHENIDKAFLNGIQSPELQVIEKIILR